MKFVHVNLWSSNTVHIICCEAPGLVQGPGEGPVHGPGQGLTFELKIQFQILKRKDLEWHYIQSGHPPPPPLNFSHPTIDWFQAIQCLILKRKDLEWDYIQSGHPPPPPPLNFSHPTIDEVLVKVHIQVKLYIQDSLTKSWRDFKQFNV